MSGAKAGSLAPEAPGLPGAPHCLHGLIGRPGSAGRGEDEGTPPKWSGNTPLFSREVEPLTHLPSVSHSAHSPQDHSPSASLLSTSPRIKPVPKWKVLVESVPWGCPWPQSGSAEFLTCFLDDLLGAETLREWSLTLEASSPKRSKHLGR